ncbi:DVL family protein [Medicago truncatula]|uniref:DVL family protein n=1 Tax=Medicago truncatula TaxID=3880 RepID=A0A072V402_MEDTR|nr:DVL family protein [Medicago truncatula]
MMGCMSKRFAKWRRMVRQQQGKIYIMRICITMLLNWHKLTKAKVVSLSQALFGRTLLLNEIFKVSVMQKVVKAIKGAENKILYHVEVYGHSSNVATVTLMILKE